MVGPNIDIYVSTVKSRHLASDRCRRVDVIFRSERNDGIFAGLGAELETKAGWLAFDGAITICSWIGLTYSIIYSGSHNTLCSVAPWQSLTFGRVTIEPCIL